MKMSLPLVIGFVALLLAGIGFYVFGRQDAAPASKEEGSTETASEGALPQAEEQGSMIGSIKDAMGLGKKMKCTYSEKDGSGVSSTVYVDGQKFKFTTEANGEKMYGVSDGDTQYMWTGTKKQGFKMTKACIEELGKTAGQATEGSGANTTTPQDFEKSFETAENVRCEAATGEDFSAPADIAFVDQCEMMRSGMKALEQMKGQLPNGFTIPGY